MRIYKLFVGNIGPEIQSTELKEEFSNFGRVLFLNHIPQKRIAFVGMANHTDAEQARLGLNGACLKNSIIRVSRARARGEGKSTRG
jgi:RNA recognition motif-containing protein